MAQGIIRVGPRATLLAVGIAATGMAQQNLLVNGSFEQGPNIGAYLTVQSPSTAMPGWTVFTGSVDINGAYWQASDGVRSLDLDGLSPGGIQQTVATTPGALHELRFDMAGNPDTPEVKRMRVTAGGRSQDFSFDSTGHSLASMGWTSMSMLFTATASTTTIEFVSLMPATSSRGPALDNVQLYSVFGTLVPFGTGCPGTAGVPQFTTNQPPRVGQPFSLILSNLPYDQLAAAVIGFAVGGLPDPIADLSSLGMTGCFQYASLDVLDVIPSTGVFGVYVWGRILGNDPSLVGLPFSVQFVIRDPSANPAGLICTRGGLGGVGS